MNRDLRDLSQVFRLNRRKILFVIFVVETQFSVGRSILSMTRIFNGARSA